MKENFFQRTEQELQKERGRKSAKLDETPLHEKSGGGIEENTFERDNSYISAENIPDTDAEEAIYQQADNHEKEQDAETFDEVHITEEPTEVQEWQGPIKTKHEYRPPTHMTAQPDKQPMKERDGSGTILPQPETSREKFSSKNKERKIKNILNGIFQDFYTSKKLKFPKENRKTLPTSKKINRNLIRNFLNKPD